MTGKLDSLKRAIEVFSPGVIMLQETKSKKQGKLKLKGFLVFEKLRDNNEGGGLMSIIHENLKPIQISDDHSEFLVVDIGGNFGAIRTINCYGPQETAPIEARTQFFIELESRIISAKSSEKYICIEFDANSKLGNGIIKDDPHEMSQNGKLLHDLISRQNLKVVNSTDKCFGTITRYKKTKRGTEESVIDFFIVCEELFQNIVKMLIDEQRQYVLSRFYKCKNRISIVESDHNLLVLYLSFKWSQTMKVERKEIYTLRNEDCQKLFKENTSNDKNLIQVLKDQDISKAGGKWMKQVKHLISKSFKKVRVSNKCEKLDKTKSDLFCSRVKMKSVCANSSSLNKDEQQLWSPI